MNCIITGGTKGIGRAIVERFAAEGANVAFCARTAADVQTTVTALKNKYPTIEVIGLVADMSEKISVQAFGAAISEKWAKVDALINNAGLFLPGMVSEEAEGTLELQMNTNLYSAYYMTRSVLPLMLPNASGHIFNICSIASLTAYGVGHSYSISKFAMLGFSKALRKEMKPKGIKVTAILPGETWSASWSDAPYPKDRLMAAEDIADAVWHTFLMKPTAVVEEMIIRPQLGDL